MAYAENRPGPAHMEPDKRKKSSKKGMIATLCVVAVLVVAGVGGWFLWDQQQKAQQAAHEAEVSALLDTDTFYQGVRVDGIDLGGRTMEQARELLNTSETGVPQTFTVTLTHEDQSFTLTQADVGYSVDTEQVLEEAYQYGRTGTREERYETVKALQTTPVDFDLSASMQDDTLSAKLQELTAPLAREAQDASDVSFNAETEEFTFSEGQTGIAVDLDSLTQKVKDAIAAGGGTVEVPVTETPVQHQCRRSAPESQEARHLQHHLHQHRQRQLQHGARHGLHQRHLRAAGRDVLLFRRGGPRRARRKATSPPTPS